MNEIEPMEFKRPRYSNASNLMGAVLFPLCSILFLCIFFSNLAGRSYLAISFMFCAGSLMGLLGFLWGRATPYIRITRDEIMVFGALARGPKFVKWSSVQKIKQKRNEVELLVSDDSKVKIRLWFVNREDRERLVSALQKIFEEKKEELGKAI